VAYTLLDEMKIIDLGWPSRSVTTSTVVPTPATAGLLVFLDTVAHDDLTLAVLNNDSVVSICRSFSHVW